MTAAFLAFAALGVALVPMASGHHASGSVDPNLNCQPEETFHVYYGSGQTRTGIWHIYRPTIGVFAPRDGNALDDCGTSASSAAYAGTCGLYPWTDPITGLGWCDGIPGDPDGDSEHAVGGAFFPGGPWAADSDCDYGTFPHHGAFPTLDDSVYPAIAIVGVQPAFFWGADDTTLGTSGNPATDAGSGKVPATDPADQILFGGDGLQCLTDGSITPGVDGDDWLYFCVGDGITICSAAAYANTYPAAGGDGGYTAFTVSEISHDPGLIDTPIHWHGGYHEACDPLDPGANGYAPLADANGDTWPDLFCHSPLDQDGDTVMDVPTTAYLTVAGTITS